MSKRLVWSVLIVASLVGGYFAYRTLQQGRSRSATVMEWLRHPQDHPDWAITIGRRCAEAPFILPTSGLVGYLWNDTFHAGRRHQGIDIFAGTSAGQTPVVAAYGGYLTRLPEWKSSVIVRLPDDPLHPGRQIWLYYTHMADRDGNSYISSAYPAGSYEIPIETGTLLGYQGNYSGDTYNPVGVHLHFSIVMDDGSGSFRNELEIQNTLDPSPYLGLPLNASLNQGIVPICPE